MNFFISLLVIVFIATCGFVVIKFFKFLENLSEFEKLPYAYGLGAGLCAFQLYLYSRLHIPWDALLIVLPWIIFFLIILIKAKSIPKISRTKIRLDLSEIILLILNILLSFYVAVEAVSRPVTSWDGWATWLFRAKIFFIDNGITKHAFSYLPFDYPLLVSLIPTFIYIFIGGIDDRMVLLYYPAFYIFLGVMFFFASKRLIGRKAAFIFTFFLLSLQNVIRHSGRFEAGQADIILGFYAFTSTLLLLSFLKRKGVRDLILLQIFLVITFFIKDDGMPFVFLLELITIFSILKSRLYLRLISLIIFFMPVVEWQFFKSIMNMPQTPVFISGKIHYERFFTILWEFLKEFLNIINWNILWPTFFLSFLLIIKKKKYSLLFLLNFLVLYQVVVYGIVFLFTTPDPHYHIPNVINRTFLHIAPIAMFAVAINTAIIRGKLKNGKI